MRADRVAAWIPLAIAGTSVTALALLVIRPALSEAEHFDREAASFEAIASREAMAVRGAERMRAALVRLGDRHLVASDEMRFTTFRRTAAFPELVPLLAAIDASPRAEVRRIELLVGHDGRVELTAEIDEGLASRIAIAEAAAP